MTTPYGPPAGEPDPRFAPASGPPTRPGRYPGQVPGRPGGFGNQPGRYPSGSGYPPLPTPTTKSSLPMVSFICGLLSFLCVPVVLAIIAIVTGVMGRKRARAEGNSTGFATAGLVLGLLNLVASAIGILLAVSMGVGVVNQVTEQMTVVRELVPASVAANAYLASRGTYAGLSTAALKPYGYTPSAGTTVTARSSADGSEYCIQAMRDGDPSSVVHLPVTAADRANGSAMDIGGDLAAYASGPCPVN